MSIDLPKVTGISDQYGVITQITDASGRVLWKLDTGPKIVYLRPSADISVDSTITLVPADATAAYMLINEEVSDGAATEIKISSSSTVSGTATFSLAGKTPNTISRVTNIRLCVSGLDVNTNKLCAKLAYVSVNGTMYQYRLSGQLDYEVIEHLPILSTIEDMLAEINDYVATNSVLPNFELSFEFSVEPKESGGKDTMTMSISQAYVVIECE